MKISIIIPSVYRPASLRRCVEAVLLTAPECEIVCALSSGDDASREAMDAYPVSIMDKHPPLTGAQLAVNAGAQAASGDVLVFIGDDCVAEAGWLEEALSALSKLPDGDGVVGLNDRQRGARDGQRFATHFLTTRAYCLRHNGGVFWTPHYYHYYTDVELCERAHALGRYVWVAGAVVRHEWRKHRDRVSESALPHFHADQDLYHRRKTAGFPNDYPAILKYAERSAI